MTVLESSLRNLVNEEATRAALKAIEGIDLKVGVDPASRADLLEAIEKAVHHAQIRMAERFADTARRAERARLCKGVHDAPASLDHIELAAFRQASIQIAVNAGLSGEALFVFAADCARFIVDGMMDGKSRPVPPEEPEAA